MKNKIKINQELANMISKYPALRLARFKNWVECYPAIKEDKIIGVICGESLYDLSGRKRLVEHAKYNLVAEFAEII